MLKVELDLARIAAQQNSYTGRGTMSGRDLAVKVKAMRSALQHDASRFNDRQEKNRTIGRPYLGDGRIETLRHLALGRAAEPELSRRLGAMFLGLHLHSHSLFPVETGFWIMKALARPVSSESHNWVARLDDGAGDEREFAPVTGLAVYFDSLRIIRIFWLGSEHDFLGARAELRGLTQDWRDWSAAYPAFTA